VLQGDNDPRVPKEEAQQVVEILKKEGRLVEAHYYPNEGHAFAKRENQIDAIRRTIDWFDKYLKGVSGVAGGQTTQSAPPTACPNNGTPESLAQPVHLQPIRQQIGPGGKFRIVLRKSDTMLSMLIDVHLRRNAILL
jgi:hypothetical protein